MTTIIAGQAAQFTVTVQVDGAPVAINSSATVNAQLFTINGLQSLTPIEACSSNATGANWTAGVVAVAFTANDTATITTGPALLVLTISNPALVRRFKINVETATGPTQSTLFIKDVVVEELRADQLLLAAQNYFSGVTLTDDYIWEKVVAAESQIKHTLRVPLVPTQFFAYTPTTPEDIALEQPGVPIDIDPAYDYDPEFFQGEKWGFIVTRQKPVQSVQRMRFAYPAPSNLFFDIPLDWIRLDQKYGHIRLVPATSAFSAPLSAFMMQALGGGRTIPFMIQLTYIAGIQNAWTTYPELIDVIKKQAVLKVVEDGFLPQSGSISADGLSQSMSVDMEKYRDTIDSILNGPKGSNGGLMTSIHGVRNTIMGW
jgi:hypothetical protein